MFTNFVNKPVGRKTQNVLSLQIIQVAIKGIVAIRVKGTVHRFKVQRSALGTRTKIEESKPS